MRTLALLLLLLNIGCLILQFGLLPMLPIQPEQFSHVTPYPNSDANDLPRLVLLSEHLESNIADSENTQASMGDSNAGDSASETVALTRLPASPTESDTISLQTSSTKTGINIADTQAKKFSLEAIPAINHSIKPSTLQQAAGLPLSQFDKSSRSGKSKDKKVTVAPTPYEVKPVTKSSTRTELSQTSLACFQVGPYSYFKATQKIANWLKKQKNVIVKVQNRQTQVLKSTWVYLPSFESRAAARRTQQRLNQQGIKDHAIVTKGRFNNAVSLGLYHQSFYAKQRLEKLVALGYKNVKTKKRYKSETKYWLNVKMPINQGQLLNTFKKKFKSPELESVACKLMTLN